ncbi:MAG: VanW family protein [bacterium]
MVVRPGEVFSVWQVAGEPTAQRGYQPAAALKAGELTQETGGAICLLSTVLYNVGLLAGLQVLEQHCHSVDSYGERRYFELGRDAAIEFGYLDLRFRNSWMQALRLSVSVTDDAVQASFSAAVARPFDVGLIVSLPEDAGHDERGREMFSVRTTRRIDQADAPVLSEDLGISNYRRAPG